MFGMSVMSSAVSPLSESASFMALMGKFSNPLLGILIGFGITAIIQSSSASVGILQALSLTGGITYSIAIPIILGQNIGTCSRRFFPVRASKNAKRSAMVTSIYVIRMFFYLLFCFSIHSDAGVLDMPSTRLPLPLSIPYSTLHARLSFIHSTNF
jgi:phosphate:Na+ symporter